MDDDDLHISRIATAWSMVREAHGDHTAVQSAQQRLLDRYGGAVRRYALSALRNEDAADEVFQEFALKFVRGDFGKADPERGRFRAFVKTVVYRLIVDYQRRAKKRVAKGRCTRTLPSRPPIRTRRTTMRCSTPVGATSCLARCWQKLADDEAQSGKPYHTVLRYRVDHPDLRSPELAAGLEQGAWQADQRRRGASAVAPLARAVCRAAAG